MREYRVHQLFFRGLKVHGDHVALDQFGHFGADHVGAEVTELIQGYVVAMNLETTEEELMHTVFPHPTLSEMMKEAVLDAYGRVLNM